VNAGADHDALSARYADTKNRRSATLPAQPTIKSPLKIQDVFVEEGKPVFLLGSCVWLSYNQALRKGASEFLTSRTLEDWERVLKNQHLQQLQVCSQEGVGGDGKFVDMKLYANELVFLFEADTIAVEASTLKDLGLLGDAVQFLAAKTSWD
jgi:hypothetical protein